VRPGQSPTARIEGARSDRAASASKKDRLAAPGPFFRECVFLEEENDRAPPSFASHPERGWSRTAGCHLSHRARVIFTTFVASTPLSINLPSH